MRVLLVALILGVAAHQASACGKFAVCTTTPLYGPANGGNTVSQLADRETNNIITKINLYYSTNLGCILGVKPTYGWSSKNAKLIGSESTSVAGFETSDITLAAGESINKVAVSATSGCITSIAFTTSSGRVLQKGTASGTTTTSTPPDNCSGGYLAALRGSATASQISQIGFIWGRDDCEATVTPPTPSPEVPEPEPSPVPSPPPVAEVPRPSPVPSPVPSPPPVAETPLPSPIPEEPSPSPTPSPAESPVPEVPSPEPEPSPVPSPEPSPVPSPVPSPAPVCEVDTTVCNPTTGSCSVAETTPVCEAVGFDVTVLDCSSASGPAACAALVCTPVVPSCTPTRTTPCLGTITGGNSSYAGQPCLVTSNTCAAPGVPSTPSTPSTPSAPKPSPKPYKGKIVYAPKKTAYGRKLLNYKPVYYHRPVYSTKKVYYAYPKPSPPAPAASPKPTPVPVPEAASKPCFYICGCPPEAPVAVASPAPVVGTGPVVSVSSSTAGPGETVVSDATNGMATTTTTMAP